MKSDTSFVNSLWTERNPELYPLTDCKKVWSRRVDEYAKELCQTNDKLVVNLFYYDFQLEGMPKRHRSLEMNIYSQSVHGTWVELKSFPEMTEDSIQDELERLIKMWNIYNDN